MAPDLPTDTAHESSVSRDPRVVEIALDASGRIGTARWLIDEQAGRPQEERTRIAS